MLKANQDAFVVRKEVAGEPDAVFFGVFDGHGSSGTDCAQFARDKVSVGLDPEQGLRQEAKTRCLAACRLRQRRRCPRAQRGHSRLRVAARGKQAWCCKADCLKAARPCETVSSSCCVMMDSM